MLPAASIHFNMRFPGLKIFLLLLMIFQEMFCGIKYMVVVVAILVQQLPATGKDIFTRPEFLMVLLILIHKQLPATPISHGQIFM